MSPRTSKQFDEIRQRSRELIMETALELFGTLGYHSTSISKIARQANISKGLMYNYFGSKRELLHAIILEQMEEGESWWQDISGKDISAYEKIEQITRYSVQTVKEDTHHWRLLTSLVFQPDVMEDVEEIIGERKVGLIQEAILLFQTLGVPQPEREAMIFGATLDGIFLHYLSSTEHYPLDEMIQYLLARYEVYRP